MTTRSASDTKNKELVGDFKNAGREWRPKGEPELVRVHDFKDKQLGKAIPHGIYDLRTDQGWVTVGIDHDTAQFAVNSIRSWWEHLGQPRYPHATRLQITADCGGSNGNRTKLWKVELQKLADDTELEIAVCHFPPGTSNWNRIEHRLFSFITMNWRGKPLTSLETIINLIGATKTSSGLEVYARLDDGTPLPATSEEEIYSALGLDWIPPELREDLGEILAAEQHRLPRLIEQADIRGDLHMHTSETDGKNTIREMAEAAIERGFAYIAITDHSKNLAMTNGLDDARALKHVERIRAVDREMEGRIRIFPGIEVDILADGAIDLSDDVLAQMDVVIASVHSHFNQPSEQMTERMLRAVENPFIRVLGHPTGRLLLRREPYALDLEAVLRRCSALGVAVEHNAYPDRLDLSDRNLRLARQLGCKIVVNTDAHHTSHLEKMRYGIRQLRRAWLRAEDVLNTGSADDLLVHLRSRPQ